eukprot:CAMPEP_0119003848 /NCGR_PEP_ID=MMETSP1176-20130426/800_1 /TAXON_ID=265551 /ORGANISM="Synedropsis recta cf, Strain CCMP1620" /LENGTH=244 /DNA_ID=CAMNT_0006955485 /DNA_START=48 /DNA_END=782 /DNA_ORIENTATION=-
MKFFVPLMFLAATALSTASAERGGTRSNSNQEKRSLQKGSKSSDDNSEDEKTLTLTIINESFNQPFGGVFVMVHNADTPRIYRRGQPASPELARLAEDGNPGPLVEYYTANNDGVSSVFGFNDDAPYFGGDTFQIQVDVSEGYPLVTIATMAINTNDCFTSINGAPLYPGMVLDLPGLDAGSEENNEMCDSIPGPGCAGISGNNVISGNGEGFVHVHRGFFGIGDLLPANRYDWRNPMMRVVVN